MKLTDKDLKTVTELAELFYTTREIALILELNHNEVQYEMLNEQSDFFKAYYKGFYESEIKHRQVIKNMSQQGSQPAIDSLSKIIIDTKIKNDG